MGHGTVADAPRYIQILATNGRDKKELAGMDRLVFNTAERICRHNGLSRLEPVLEQNIRDRAWTTHFSMRKRIPRLYEMDRNFREAAGVLGWKKWETEAFGKFLIVMLDLSERSCYTTYPHGGRAAKYSHVLTPMIFELKKMTGNRIASADNARVHLSTEVHDIGKAAIPFEILRIKKRLTNENKALIGTHAICGNQILAAMAEEVGTHRLDIEVIRNAVLMHHANGKIPLTARIVKLCDILDTTTSWRVYHEVVRTIGWMIQVLNGKSGDFGLTVEERTALLGGNGANHGNDAIRKIKGIVWEGRKEA
jgi:response regulator RpfG family c-di-GMP phosphodiesterase